MAELSDWKQWKEQCARRLCGQEEQSRLAAFAYTQAASRARRLGCEDKAKEWDGADWFHMLEVHCLLHVPGNPAKGANYKDWIFKRVETLIGTPLSIIEKGASLLIRDAVREVRSHEWPEADSLSVVDDDPGSSRNLTAPEDTDLTRRDCEQAAANFAGDLYPGLNEAARLSILIPTLGLALTNPAVWDAAGLKRAQLYHHREELHRRVRTGIQSRIGSDGDAESELLFHFTLQALGDLALEAARQEPPESPARRLLSLAEEPS